MADRPSDSECYLELVERELPFDDEERWEVLEELRAHLADSAAALEASGTDPADAERKAVERLGSPRRLADELTRSRRDSSRLLAAAGAGAWGVMRGAFWGGVVGVVIWILGFLALVVVANIVFHQLGILWNNPDGPTVSAFLLITIGMILFVAGRLVTASVAAAAAFQGRVVRRLTVPVGFALAMAYSLLVWHGPLNWVSAIVLISLPLWWLAGAWQIRPIHLESSERLVRVLVVAAAVLFVAPLLTATRFPWSKSYEPSTAPFTVDLTTFDPGFSRIAPAVPAGLNAAAGLTGTVTTGSADRFVESAVMTSRSPFAGWTDLRVESWWAIWPNNEPAYVDPTETQPLATSPAEWFGGATTIDGADLSAALVAADSPDACMTTTGASAPCTSPGIATLSALMPQVRTTQPGFVFMAFTGVAPDGHRYLIDSTPDIQRISFEGTGLDWIEAALAGR
jgi:hypothetical protein